MVINLIYSKKMYVSPNIGNINEVKEILNSKTALYNIYIICISKNNKNLFEIIHSTEIFKSIYRNKKFTIVGLANGKKDSFNLLVNIIEDFSKSGKNFCQISEFF